MAGIVRVGDAAIPVIFLPSVQTVAESFLVIFVVVAVVAIIPTVVSAVAAIIAPIVSTIITPVVSTISAIFPTISFPRPLSLNSCQIRQPRNDNESQREG